MTSSIAWSRFPILCACSLAVAGAAPGLAQDEALVDDLARLLQAEDERRFDAGTLQELIRHPEALVRRQAALAIGRVGDRAGTPLLTELLRDPDSLVQATAAFALGVLGDPAAADALGRLVTEALGGPQQAAHTEAATALARIGGPGAVAVFSQVLDRAVGQVAQVQPPVVDAVLLESWRLGSRAPVQRIRQFADAALFETRWRAVYTLARLRDPGAGAVLLNALADREPRVRGYAARALVRGYADTAGLEHAAVVAGLRRLVSDQDPHVRVDALAAAGTYRDTALAGIALDRLRDSDPNVRVQAVTMLGAVGGAEAVAALLGMLQGQRWAVRRAALLGLARAARSEFDSVTARWARSADWRERFTAAEALGARGVRFVAPALFGMLDDPDARVVGKALHALGDALPPSDTGLLGAARRLLRHPDPVVRSVAADHLAEAPHPSDVPLLVDAYRRAAGDNIDDARLSAVRALGAVAHASAEGVARVSSAFLDGVPAPDDYLVRRMAERHLPAAAQRWGPWNPVVTGRALADYRDVVRRVLLPAAVGGANPRVTIEGERGSMVIELFAAAAPLTVDNFLRLVDRRWFDGGAWHRVVPNFVVQDGDPRGDGWGAPETVLRDEVNRHRYERGTMGMALSGPDTGGSQFFITLSPQPHLDGAFTAFGQVTEGYAELDQITQGDRIRQIRR